MKPLALSTIQQAFSGLIGDRLGQDLAIRGFGSKQAYATGDLIFWDSDKVEALLANPPSAVVTTREIAGRLAHKVQGILVCDDVQLAHALIRQRYDDHDPHDHEWPRIHPSAVIHESAGIAANVSIAPGVVIGRDVRLGEYVVVQSNSVIEHDARIGARTVVQSNVTIGRGCHIGEGVVIKHGAVIGGEGFGFARDADKHFHRIPHKGNVVIEDDVVVGANCNIDRGTYGETRIRRRTKIDALCHIAHNVFIDEDCAITAQAAIAGSSRIGKRVLASGQTGVLDHMTIADDVVLVHRAGVVEDITEPGMYAATPTQPFRDYTRNLVNARKLSELRRQVNTLERKIKELASKEPSDDKLS